MKTKRKFYLLLICVILMLTNCTKPIIVGKVIDNFGNPISGVSVSVDGTQFNAITNDLGEYSIGYVPGDITVTFKKDNYSESKKTFNIATESKFPAEQVELIQIPKDGVSYIDKSSYLELQSGKVLEQKSYYNDQSLWHNTITVTTYTVQGDFNKINDLNPKFIMNIGNVQSKLIKLMNNDVMVIFDRGAFGTSEPQYEVIDERIQQLAPNVALWTVSLKPGKYAFAFFDVTNGYNPRKPFKSNFYLSSAIFEIREPLKTLILKKTFLRRSEIFYPD